ncbi:hypothetical protein DL95DRAFT_481211 [Leptodontidium sp. 2 PMI_412]|nr:hypothetical protein DL95DRAFT_481211 [Leptodontidium sp. 2 PMI_412]
MALRLIHTSTLRLESFLVGRIPEYAILSHTWTDGHEISYEEMDSINSSPSHPATNKFGYSKIMKSCAVSRALGLDYVWVDTCCIKKSSSAELSEAINSMFQWYQNAESVSLTSRICHQPATSTIACLGELIAPRNVRFYNCRWDCIGGKIDSDLLGLISRISGIDERVLVDASILPSLSVAKKMSWAASRETTKPEDLAYCLMGIFDVNMPLLYGEGSKAFLRLQEEIIKRSNDLSIFAWGHPETTQSYLEEGTRPARDVEGEGHAGRLPATQSDCCGLLAESASNFANCGKLVLHTATVRRNIAFSMTNNGIFFSQMKLRVNFESGCYVLPLLCYEEESPLDGTYLTLRKVGPDLFARLENCYWEDLFRWNDKVSGYVVTKMTPETMVLTETCRVESVQLSSPLCSNVELHAAIVEVSPEETWDLSTLTFLEDDDEPFTGHVKFDGPMLCRAFDSSTAQRWDDIHLVWWGGDFHTRETVWVYICWARDWEEGSNSRALPSSEVCSI